VVLHAAVNKINHLTKRLGKYLSSYLAVSTTLARRG
jgi:hypothetical protein